MSTNTPAPAGYKVKLYSLSAEGGWDDKGVGRVTCKYIASVNSQALQVISEGEKTKGKLLLQSPVSMDHEIYRRQSPTIIVWSDPESQLELALSFQEKSGCEAIWTKICAIQGRVYGSHEMDSKTPDPELRPAEVEGKQDESEQNEEHDDFFIDLAEVNEKNLGEIAQVLEQIANAGPVLKEHLAQYIIQQEDDKESYLEKLVLLFRSLEENPEVNTENLHLLCKIIKNVALLNSFEVFQAILSDDMFENIIGILEYDPDLAAKENYRSFLKNEVKFKQIVPITDESILQRVHQNFRIGFLRDVLMPRAFDEFSVTLLGEMEYFNGVEIASKLHADNEFLSKLFKLLSDATASQETRAQVVKFMQELCTLAKRLLIPARNAFYRSFTEREEDFFGILKNILADEESNATERIHVGDILQLVLEHDAELVRSYIMKMNQHPLPPPTDNTEQIPKSKFAISSGNEVSFLAQLIRLLVYDPEPGMQAQACDVLKAMLDPESMEVSEKESFLAVFYDYYIQWIVYPLNFAGKTSSVSKTMNRIEFEEQRRSIETTRVAEHYISELLSVCIQTHGYRIKYFVLRNSVVSRVLNLLESKEKHLVLDAIRFIRTCVGLKDEFYNKSFVRDNLFKGIFEVFKKHRSKNNLINSAIIELIEFIRMENINTLIVYIIENYEDALQKADYVEIYGALKRQYELNKSGKGEDPSEGNRSKVEIGNAEKPSITVDVNVQDKKENKQKIDEEEAYFENDETQDSKVDIEAPNSSEASSLDEGKTFKPRIHKRDDDSLDTENAELSLSAKTKGKRKRNSAMQFSTDILSAGNEEKRVCVESLEQNNRNA